MRRVCICFLCLCFVLLQHCFGEDKVALPVGPGKQVAVFVALCDNVHQGIAPVPPRIGNGEDAAHNLYWGCSDALPKVMRASRDWGRPQYYSDYAKQHPAVIDTVVCSRADATATVYAYAYRGDSIAACMRDFEAALASGQYDLVAFIGHNGLMDVDLPELSPARGNTDAVVLCCMSDEYFSDRIRRLGGRPVLMTRQNMYPAGKVLTELLSVWLKTPADTSALHAAAARAYAQNQGISFKAASGVFVSPGK
ncbi:MAG: hypothetical protein Q4A24_09795 [Akkermansia sp.]|nr:hypothetical protein [Akkermansia sp.]MDO4752383.1 hypothetical protein [Akkermansia sp.]